MFDPRFERTQRLHYGINNSTGTALKTHTAPDKWNDWLHAIFPAYVTAPFSERHDELWDWVANIQPKIRPSPFVAIWPRGGGKSTTAELLAVMLGALGVRKYCWYVSATQELADKHVDSISALIEDSNFEKYYPKMANRAVGKYGDSKGWRRNRLHCGNGFIVDPLGLNTGGRGTKVQHLRPDLIIGDDLDDVLDTLVTTKKKSTLLKKSIFPAGSPDCATLLIQNLILPEGIFGQLADRTADFLTTRQLSGPIPAVYDLAYESKWSEEHKENVYFITQGTASWEGQSLAICEQQINDWGPQAFLEESQHEVSDFDGEMFSHLEYEQCAHHEVPPLSKIYCAIDPAVTSTDNSDCHAIQIDGLDPVTGRIYRLFSWERRATPVESLEIALYQSIKYKVRKIFIETNQGGDTWSSVVKEAWENLIKSSRHKEITKATRRPSIADAKATKATGDKVYRAGKMLSDYEFGRFVHVLGTHDVLERALRRFPLKKPYDLVDASYYTWDAMGPREKRKPKVHAL